MELFTFPAVYDTAFQFRNAQKVVDFVEHCVNTYSDISVFSIIDIACGTGYYMREFARHQYEIYGIDINAQVCQYARWRAQAEALNVTVLQGDMVNFSLPVRCDLAVNFFDSLTYITEWQKLITHFAAVSKVLVSGGLYIIEFGVIDLFTNHNVEEIWTETRRALSVTTTYFRDAWINPENNIFIEKCSFQATCREHAASFRVKFLKRALFLDEFKRLIKQAGGFTSLAYYDDFKPKALLEEGDLPWRVIAILKKTS